MNLNPNPNLNITRNKLSFSHSLSNAFPNPLMMVLPLIDGVPLTSHIKAFESAQGWTSGSSYSGLLPKIHCDCSIREYFLGLSGSTEWTGGRTTVLACDCGVPTCWPLLARITRDEKTISWSHFMQPHRPAQDYSAFGPFTFKRKGYTQVLQKLEAYLLKQPI